VFISKFLPELICVVRKKVALGSNTLAEPSAATFV